MKNKLTIYILSGLGFSGKIFDETNLNKEFNLIYFEFHDIKNFSLDTAAQLFGEKLFENAIILAWSFGGLLAIKIANLFPKKIKKIIFIASSPKFLEDKNWTGIKNEHAINFQIQFKDYYPIANKNFIGLINFPNKNIVYKNILTKYFFPDKEKFLLQLDILLSVDLRHEYINLNTNILHIIYKSDAVIPINISQLKLLKSDSKIIYIKNAGHTGFLAQPYLHADIIKTFIYE